mgnify:CR=1 FL=1
MIYKIIHKGNNSLSVWKREEDKTICVDTVNKSLKGVGILKTKFLSQSNFFLSLDETFTLSYWDFFK